MFLLVVCENDQIKLINAEIDLLLQYFSREQAQAKLSEALTEYPQNLVLLLKKIELFELQDKPNELMTVLTEARDVFDENDRFWMKMMNALTKKAP